MVFNYTYRIGLEDCGRENKATNKAILTILENIAGLHSATVGLGLNEISETGCAWVVLNWQMQIIKRPEYNDELTVYTWSTSADKLFAERDFKITDKDVAMMMAQMKDTRVRYIQEKLNNIKDKTGFLKDHELQEDFRLQKNLLAKNQQKKAHYLFIATNFEQYKKL